MAGSAVRTAGPATGAALPFLQLRADTLDVQPSGFGFLDGDYPADPLIACERGDVLPFCARQGVRKENLS